MTNFLKSPHESWASDCWLLRYCYIVLSCLDRIGCTSLEQKRYQVEEPSHGAGILNEENKTRIAMHPPDHLLNNPAEDTYKIDSALVSRTVAFSILERRYHFLEAFSFWFGECLFHNTYWTNLLPIQLTARMLEEIFTDIMVHAATDWSQRPLQPMVLIRLDVMVFFIHNPHGVVQWAFAVECPRILRPQVWAGHATRFSTLSCT